MTAPEPPRRACALCLEQVPHTPEAVVLHATERHPAYLPDLGKLTVPAMCELIVRLVGEVRATLRAPNPSGESGRAAKGDAAPLPISAAVLDLLAPADGDNPGRPMSLLVECSRVAWEAIDHVTRCAHPQPDGEAQWSTEARWLGALWPDAVAQLDVAEVGWIEDTLRDLCRKAGAVARVGTPTRYLCPDCGDAMHLGEGDWMVCESGVHMHPGPGRLETEWRRKGPMGTQALAAKLRIPEGTIRRWHHERKIAPVRQEGRTWLWLPWDLVALRYPDIVAAIDDRDAQPVG